VIYHQSNVLRCVNHYFVAKINTLLLKCIRCFVSYGILMALYSYSRLVELRLIVYKISYH